MRKAASALYVIASFVVLAVAACKMSASCVAEPLNSVFPLISNPMGFAVVVVCLAIVAVHTLAVLVSMVLDKPEPVRMRLGANPDIEVSVEALRSVARAAAASPDVMIEDVRARVVGRDKDGVDIRVEAIALAQHNLEGLAHRVQNRVQAACDDMLGVPGARVQVCFLPSKTMTVTKEVMR